ncbi:hypothetical protein [Sporisorium scitamineum]|uniref:Uncharacterized protein n=1 Tax=Sporisorium scitamineum TaxID=49012 RepID=A0A0F7S7B8_9BASI|nr:hypothetical protein [Sporisorium scitamineum]
MTTLKTQLLMALLNVQLFRLMFGSHANQFFDNLLAFEEAKSFPLIYAMLSYVGAMLQLGMHRSKHVCGFGEILSSTSYLDIEKRPSSKDCAMIVHQFSISPILQHKQ